MNQENIKQQGQCLRVYHRVRF